MKTKLTTTQARAKAHCDRAIEALVDRKYAESWPIVVEWKRSAMYGKNPVIYNGFNNHKMTSVSGCGYCKLSTALADVLCFLFPVGSVEHNDIARQAGVGERAVIDTLAKYGWKLEPVAASLNSDAYRLSKSN
jgi:hypothetical protein